jgi:hypothetical protein
MDHTRMNRTSPASRFVAEILALGRDQFLVWGAGPALDSDAIALPAERARQVVHSAFRHDRDVRARLLALHLRLRGSAHDQNGVAASDADFERALTWAMSALEAPAEHGRARLHVLLRARPRVAGPFLPVGPPPVKPPESVVPDKLSFLEFEVLDQHGDPLSAVPYEVTFPDGEIRRGRLSNAGYAFIDGVPPGSYKIAFPQAEQPEEEDEADFLDIELVTTEGEPLGGFAFVATFSDGSKWEGVLDDNGRAHLAPVPPGDFEVRFPALEAEQDESGGDDAGDESFEDDDGNDNALEPDDGSPALVADDRLDNTKGAEIDDDHDAGDGDVAPHSSEPRRGCARPPGSESGSNQSDLESLFDEGSA